MTESDAAPSSNLEADRLRDEVIRRMANTKPKPKGASGSKPKEPSRLPDDGQKGD